MDWCMSLSYHIVKQKNSPKEHASISSGSLSIVIIKTTVRQHCGKDEETNEKIWHHQNLWPWTLVVTYLTVKFPLCCQFCVFTQLRAEHVCAFSRTLINNFCLILQWKARQNAQRQQMKYPIPHSPFLPILGSRFSPLEGSLTLSGTIKWHILLCRSPSQHAASARAWTCAFKLITFCLSRASRCKL